MTYQRTQVSISPEDHAFLTREAASRGVSMAELFRQIVSDYRNGREHPVAARGFESIIGIATAEGGRPDAADDTIMGEAMEALYRKKMGAPAVKGSGSRGRRRR